MRCRYDGNVIAVPEKNMWTRKNTRFRKKTGKTGQKRAKSCKFSTTLLSMFEHMRKGTLNMSVLQAWATTQLRQNSYLVSLYELVELQESWQSTWRLGALGGWYYGWNFYFWGKVWELQQTEQKKTCYRPISMPGYGRECPELPGNAQGSPGEAGNFQLVVIKARKKTGFSLFAWPTDPQTRIPYSNKSQKKNWVLSFCMTHGPTDPQSL